MIPTKKAARDQRTATTKYHRRPEYRSPSAVSSPPSKNLTAEAMGALLIYLVGRRLPKAEQEFGWRLLAKWTRELVELRHAKHGMEAA